MPEANRAGGPERRGVRLRPGDSVSASGSAREKNSGPAQLPFGASPRVRKTEGQSEGETRGLFSRTQIQDGRRGQENQRRVDDGGGGPGRRHPGAEEFQG